MRILDEKNDKGINKVTILLKKNEALEMFNDLQSMVRDGRNNYHTHICDEEFQHEVTMAIYQEDDLNQFDERTIRLILEDK